jgi:predicted RND superfamily exporter protein
VRAAPSAPSRPPEEPLHGSGPLYGRRFLERLTRLAILHPLQFVAVALVVLVSGGWLASKLPIQSSFEQLLPSNLPSVRQVKELGRRVGGDGTVLLTVEMLRGPEDLPAARKLTETLGQELMSLGPQAVRSIQWNVGPIERYYEDRWPLFLSVPELKEGLLQVDQTVHKLKRKHNPFLLGLSDEEKDKDKNEEPAVVDSPWLDPAQKSPRERVAERFKRYQDGYLSHPDGRSLTILVRPTGTALGVEQAQALIDRMRQIVNRHGKEIADNHLYVGFGGTFPLFVAEYKAIIEDVASTAALCLTLILVSLVLFYRDVRSTLTLGFAVIVAVTMTFGLTRLVIGYLSTQTAFLGSIVVGNGINYGLIYLARVGQLRREGVGLTEACLDAAPTTAHATLLAALGSSVSFGMLAIAQNRGFRHFGFIGGVGMLLCWVMTFALVPALLSLFERMWPVVDTKPRSRPGLKAAPTWLKRTFAHPWVIIAVFLLAGVASAVEFVSHLGSVIEKDLANLGNELNRQSTLVRDNKRANMSLGKSSAGAVALMGNWEEADAYCDVVRQRQKDPRFAKVLDGCETLSNVVPRDQEERLALIRQLADRLTDARIDLLAENQRDRARQIRADLRAQGHVNTNEAPAILVDRFREVDGSLGKLAVAVASPDAELELGNNLQAFVTAVRQVPVDNHQVDATGENVIFADLISNIEKEGPLTTFGSLFGVAILVSIFFRHWRSSIELLGTLVLGVLMMAGVATAMGLKINFFNFIVFPITFGIAVDYGANVLVRVHERGGKVVEALNEVGGAVALCSWTSMVGYGSLLLATNRALRSFGRYAILGEITSILCALVLLPAVRILWRRHGPVSPTS